ncbi:MAG TPA: hypothetical protein VK524_32815 [Polyangiaceae bacterium]|nr:hypothetical protein [Polyangiaceae bacterium]
MSWKRWRGVKNLLESAVENGSRAIERVHKETARRPFTILENIPPIALPARGIHELHDHVVSAVHGSIRITNRVVGQCLDVVFDTLDEPESSGRSDGS